jgi:archaellum biogenesis protein FlaJ (TadC family)
MFLPVLKWPEFEPVRNFSKVIERSGRADGFFLNYEKCRLDLDADEYLYRTAILAACIAIMGYICLISAIITGVIIFGLNSLPIILSIPIMIGVAIFYTRLFSIKSLKDYRGAMIDAKAVHATGFMLTMAESNVPLKRMFQNLSNLADVYGEDIALESTYVLALVDEDGMDIISAINKAQSTSPSGIWQELLIGMVGVYRSGGCLKEFLKGKYDSLAERKRTDIRKFNGTVQGLSSIYLSIVGVSAIFIALINLVFNMAGLFSNDSLIWLDSLIIVPIGSYVVMRIIRVSNPEA